MSGFIFTNRFGTIHNPLAVNRAIKRIYEAHNAEEIVKAKNEHRGPVIIPHFSCHHLRHTFCTRFCQNETNVKVIQSIMGHASIETTMDIYAKVTEMTKKEALDNLSANLDIFQKREAMLLSCKYSKRSEVQQIRFFGYCMVLDNTSREITGMLDNTGFYSIVP